MTHSRKNQGVCSHTTTVTLADDGTITDIVVTNGCDGNLSGICALLKGMPGQDAAKRLSQITCDDKKSSCPQQISICIEEALAKI